MKLNWLNRVFIDILALPHNFFTAVSLTEIRLPIIELTHWGQVTHICVNKIIMIGSDNGLSPGRRQVIIWTNAGILLIGPLGTNFSESLIDILTFSFKKMRLKVSSAKWRPFCLGLNVLRASVMDDFHINYRIWLLLMSQRDTLTGKPSRRPHSHLTTNFKLYKLHIYNK